MQIAYLANVRIPSERAHSAQIVHMCESFVKSVAQLDLYANTRTEGTLKEIGNFYIISTHFNLIRLTYGVFNPKIRATFYISEFIFTLNFLLTRKNNYDYVYSRSEWIVWFLSLFLPSHKLVWESHEAKQNYPARQIIKKGIKIVVISEGIRDEYQPSVQFSNQLLVAHDGIDESFYGPVETKQQSRDRLGIDHNKRVAMYIGGFDAWKGIDTFCKCADYTDASLVVIGGSESDVVTYRKKYPKILFLGQRPYAELKDNQQAADILVVPNSSKEKVSSIYTSPLKLFAHMSSGIPIVVANVPSISVILNQNEATFFEPDNSKSLTEAINIVFVDYASKNNASLKLKEETKKYLWTERAKNILRFISTK